MKTTPCVWEEGLAGEFWQKGRLPFPVYDVHGHMGLHPAIYMSHAAAETMARHLRRAGAKLIFTHHYALNDWSFRNATCVEIARRFPDVLRVYMAVNPHCQPNIEEDLALYDSWAPTVCGLKILADYHRTSVLDAKERPSLAESASRPSTRAHGAPQLLESRAYPHHLPRPPAATAVAARGIATTRYFDSRASGSGRPYRAPARSSAPTGSLRHRFGTVEPSAASVPTFDEPKAILDNAVRLGGVPSASVTVNRLTVHLSTLQPFNPSTTRRHP